MMFSLIATAVIGQALIIGGGTNIAPSVYSVAPNPYFNPVGFQHYAASNGMIFGPVASVAAPKVIETGHKPFPDLVGRVTQIDASNDLIYLKLPVKTVAIRFGPHTKWDGFYGDDLEIGSVISVDRFKNSITRLK